MDDLITLHGVATSLSSEEGRAFVQDCTRAGENLISDADVKAKYEISDATFAAIAANKAVQRAVRAEAEKRTRLGISARESAARIHARAPAIIGSILDDKGAHPRFRLEAARDLKSTALGDSSTEMPANAAEKFVITINLGADHIERYEVPSMKSLPNKDKTIDNDWGWNET